MDSQTIYAKVNERYGATARAKDNPKYGAAVAAAFGYSPEELRSIPLEANLGVSCGNPLAIANVKEGETVVDLGSGAGFDVFLAARKVGETGKAIGVDMNEDMLSKARRNAEKNSITNASFVSSTITSIDLPDSSADVIISNCVINLVPDAEKPQVFREIYRLLKPGGRVAVSDILAKKELPEQMKNDLALYVGCVAGASKKEEYETWLEEAGLQDTMVVDAEADMNVYTQTGEDGVTVGEICCGPVVKEKKQAPANGSGCCKPEQTVSCCGGSKNKEDGGVVADLKTSFSEVDLNEWVGSFKIFAVKPAI